MPTYRVTLPTGEKYRVDSPTELTDEQVLAQIRGQQGQDTSALDLLNKPAEEPSLLDKVYETFKTPLKAGLEVMGRPGEFVSGAVAGTLKNGPVAGLKRGWDAFSEGNFSDSKINESTSKILQENNILNDHPYVQAGVGFAGDVLTDPLNLLGGAGIARKTALKAADAVGVPKAAAKTALGLGIGEAFQNKVVPAGQKLVKDVIASTPLKSLHQNINLARVKGASGRSAYDESYLKGAKRKAMDERDKSFIGETLTKNLNLDEKERRLLSDAIANPHGSEAKLVNSDPRLTAARDTVVDLFDTQWKEDVANKLMPSTQSLFERDDIPNGVKQQLASLTSGEAQQIQQAIVGATDQYGYLDRTKLGTLPSRLAGIARYLSDEVGATLHRGDTPVVNLKTLNIVPKSGQSGAFDATVSTQIPNYITQIAQPKPQVGVVGAAPLSTVNPHLGASHGRKYTWDLAKKEGAETDIGVILQKRFVDSNRALQNRDLLTTFFKDFGSATPKPGFRELKVAHTNHLTPDLKALLAQTPHLPEAVADDIEKVFVRLEDEKSLEGVWTAGSKLFRTMATSLNIPGHQITNFLGNVTNMYASGMPPTEVLKSVAQATKALRKGGDTLSPVVVNGQTLRTPEIIRAAQKYGTLGGFSGFAGEFAKAEKQTPAAKAMFGQTGNPLAIFNPDTYSGVRNLNQNWIEDPAKLALFHWNLKQGKSIEDAALATKNVLFDYSELSDFEKKVVRPILPFYTWSRKNIPLQVANLLQRPTRLKNQERLLDVAWQMAEHDDVQDVPKPNLPSFLQSGEVMPIPGQAGEDNLPVYARARLPMFDLNLATTDSSEFAKKAAFMLSPPIRVAIEQAMNHRMGDPSFITLGGREVPAGVLGKLFGEFMGAKWDPDKGWRQTARQRHLQEGIPIPLGGLTRTAASAQGREETDLSIALEFILRSLGLSPTQLSEEDLARALADMTRKENEKNAQ